MVLKWENPGQAIILTIVLLILWLLYVVISRVLRNYKRRYAECLVEMDEALLTVIRATNLLMDGYEIPHIEIVIWESVEKNHLVQRVFESHNVLYLHQTGRKWIMNRVKMVKKQCDII